MDKFHDKLAVVTGAASGIGEATARRLVAEGLVVAGIDRQLERLQELATQLPANRFHPYKCDISSEADIVQAFSDIDRDLGSITVLINNAGVGHWCSMIDPSADALRSLFAINCIGQSLCAREALRNMNKYGVDVDGYILFTNSMAAHVIQSSPTSATGPPVPIHGYNATKQALKVLVEGLRQELRAKNSKIHVGQVCPGAVNTRIALSFGTDEGTAAEQTERLDKFRDIMASEDLLQPEDVADAFVFMLSRPERADVNDVLLWHKPKT